MNLAWYRCSCQNVEGWHLAIWIPAGKRLDAIKTFHNYLLEHDIQVKPETVKVEYQQQKDNWLL